MHEFQESGYLDWCLNTTFISLISKIDGEKRIMDFRPISLCLKILRKNFGLQAKESHTKTRFPVSIWRIEENKIQEGALVANKIIDSRFKEKNPGVIFKVDFQKAFDTVS